MFKKSILIVIAILCAMHAPECGAMMKKVAFEQKLRGARLIFVGTVLSREAVTIDRKYLAQLHTTDWFRVRFSISHLLKDEDNLVRRHKLQLYREAAWVEDTPEFAVGDNVVLIAYTGKWIIDGVPFVTAAGTKFEIRADQISGKREVFSEEFGEKVKSVNAEEVTFAKPGEAGLPLREFISQIKGLLQQGEQKNTQ